MLEIRHLTKIYGNSFKAVDDVSLIINDGEIFAFIGPNGAGKTTTIKSVVGLHDYNSGEIFFNGVNIKNDMISFKKTLAYIPDNPELYENLTGYQFLNFIGDIYNIDKNQRIADIQKYADIFGISSNLGDLISSYSHGMRQKLSLISAFIRHPKLFILDEPFVGLDPKASHDVKVIMKEMCANGTSVFFSTHVLEVAEKLCDRVAIIKDGRIVAYGKMEDIKGDKSLEEVFLSVATDKAENEEIK